jgi:protein SCO1/2
MKLTPKIKHLLFLPCVFLINCTQQPFQPSLPILGEKKVVSGDTVYHHIGNFKLLNQRGDTISNASTKGKIYVANFFFATCQSICPQMSSNLTRVQKQYLYNDTILILSHSVNPLHDTVEVLERYAASYGAIKNKWHLLTGSKQLIYDLAKNSYLVNALEDDGTPEGFLHSQLFLLVDTKARLRGMYEGTDSLSVNQLVNDIQILRQEKP